MSQTMVSIRMDEDLKANLEAVCRELGMNTTTAFTIFARKVCREHRIPFEVSVDPFYSEANQESTGGRFSVSGRERKQSDSSSTVSGEPTP